MTCLETLVPEHDERGDGIECPHPVSLQQARRQVDSGANLRAFENTIHDLVEGRFRLRLRLVEMFHVFSLFRTLLWESSLQDCSVVESVFSVSISYTASRGWIFDRFPALECAVVLRIMAELPRRPRGEKPNTLSPDGAR